MPHASLARFIPRYILEATQEAFPGVIPWLPKGMLTPELREALIAARERTIQRFLAELGPNAPLPPWLVEAYEAGQALAPRVPLPGLPMPRTLGEYWARIKSPEPLPEGAVEEAAFVLASQGTAAERELARKALRLGDIARAQRKYLKGDRPIVQRGFEIATRPEEAPAFQEFRRIIEGVNPAIFGIEPALARFEPLEFAEHMYFGVLGRASQPGIAASRAPGEWVPSSIRPVGKATTRLSQFELISLFNKNLTPEEAREIGAQVADTFLHEINHNWTQIFPFALTGAVRRAVGPKPSEEAAERMAKLVGQFFGVPPTSISAISREPWERQALQLVPEGVTDLLRRKARKTLMLLKEQGKWVPDNEMEYLSNMIQAAMVKSVFGKFKNVPLYSTLERAINTWRAAPMEDKVFFKRLVSMVLTAGGAAGLTLAWPEDAEAVRLSRTVREFYRLAQQEARRSGSAFERPLFKFDPDPGTWFARDVLQRYSPSVWSPHKPAGFYLSPSRADVSFDVKTSPARVAIEWRRSAGQALFEEVPEDIRGPLLRLSESLSEGRRRAWDTRRLIRAFNENLSEAIAAARQDPDRYNSFVRTVLEKVSNPLWDAARRFERAARWAGGEEASETVVIGPGRQLLQKLRRAFRPEVAEAVRELTGSAGLALYRRLARDVAQLLDAERALTFRSGTDPTRLADTYKDLLWRWSRRLGDELRDLSQLFGASASLVAHAARLPAAGRRATYDLSPEVARGHSMLRFVLNVRPERVWRVSNRELETAFDDFVRSGEWQNYYSSLDEKFLRRYAPVGATGEPANLDALALEHLSLVRDMRARLAWTNFLRRKYDALLVTDLPWREPPEVVVLNPRVARVFWRNRWRDLAKWAGAGLLTVAGLEWLLEGEAEADPLRPAVRAFYNGLRRAVRASGRDPKRDLPTELYHSVVGTDKTVKMTEEEIEETIRRLLRNGFNVDRVKLQELGKPLGLYMSVPARQTGDPGFAVSGSYRLEAFSSADVPTTLELRRMYRRRNEPLTKPLRRVLRVVLDPDTRVWTVRYPELKEAFLEFASDPRRVYQYAKRARGFGTEGNFVIAELTLALGSRNAALRKLAEDAATAAGVYTGRIPVDPSVRRLLTADIRTWPASVAEFSRSKTAPARVARMYTEGKNMLGWGTSRVAHAAWTEFLKERYDVLRITGDPYGWPEEILVINPKKATGFWRDQAGRLGALVGLGVLGLAMTADEAEAGVERPLIRAASELLAGVATKRSSAAETLVGERVLGKMISDVMAEEGTNRRFLLFHDGTAAELPKDELAQLTAQVGGRAYVKSATMSAFSRAFDAAFKSLMRRATVARRAQAGAIGEGGKAVARKELERIARIREKYDVQGMDEVIVDYQGTYVVLPRAYYKVLARDKEMQRILRLIE